MGAFYLENMDKYNPHESQELARLMNAFMKKHNWNKIRVMAFLSSTFVSTCRYYKMPLKEFDDLMQMIIRDYHSRPPLITKKDLEEKSD